MALRLKSQAVAEGDDFLTLAEAARYLRVSEKTLHGLVTKGRVPAARLGVQWRLSRRQLREFVEAEAARASA
jgi:excisionase family DNA binding protein